MEQKERLLRMPEVERRTGLKRARIYQLMSEGRFPLQVPISGSRAVGWSEQEVDAYITERKEARHQRGAGPCERRPSAAQMRRRELATELLRQCPDAARRDCAAVAEALLVGTAYHTVLAMHELSKWPEAQALLQTRLRGGG